MSIMALDKTIAYKPPNFLIENRQDLTSMYSRALGEKEAIKKLVSLNNDYSVDNFLVEYTRLDSLVKAIASIVFP